ncbi:acyl-CoA dehydrogenase [Albimonas sp. CAU 1670]|uniref:acyl-CoA dehydrogenase family protein n=1 Tax=Albimonas sp. CAU 1670 TaxID=3032599 RepID=UPI0023DACDD7|nr:acyl-CoA dehydrogenase [Albimonas sp. CAU 1670]MDF2234092.1 acyl-CoA dehydrogenase [Albimonas sp. CAU 1670]
MPAFDAEERALLHDAATAWFAGNYSTDHARAQAGTDDGFDRAAWKAWAEMGWLGLALPEAAGGSEGGLTELAILFAAAGGSLAQEPLLPCLGLAAPAIAELGTSDQVAALDAVARGERILGFLHYEPTSGYARDHVETLAERGGDGWVLTGAKAFALGAGSADALLVSARIGSASGPVALFEVPADAPGLELTPAPALDGRRGAAARLAAVRLPEGALLGGVEDDRLAFIDRLLDRAGLLVCAEAAGAMTRAAAATTDYLKQRKQFGAPLSTFQVIQHRLADLQVRCEEARAVTHSALEAQDAGAPNAAEAARQARVTVGEDARVVGAEAVQLHGGMGMTEELAAGRFYKRLVMLEALFGDGDWHLERLAADIDVSALAEAAARAHLATAEA